MRAEPNLHITEFQVRSFNFLATDSYNHLQAQSYKACVRRERGYCRIAWTQSDDPDSFKVGRPVGNYNSLTGSASCNEDYVTIPLGSNEGQHLNGVSACSTPAVSNLATIDRSPLSFTSLKSQVQCR